ncbi:MAG TPA: hypothetical protein PLM06_02030 [Anaerolineae bacterium]|nr:hypothetical protein [Anaerolineae bacterium]
MLIELLSIIIFTFALALFLLGGFTLWIEKARRRTLGVVMMLSALLVAGGYAFLGSRFSIALLGRLIILVDLPRLMATALVYTSGVLIGLALAGGLFLWISGRIVRPTQLERYLALFVGVTLLIGLLISLMAIAVSR